MTTFKKLLIGFTAGAIVGVLYAPHKGSKTRRKLANIGSDMKEGWNNLADTVAEKIDDIRSGVENLADNTIDRVENTQFDLDQAEPAKMSIK